MGGWENSSEFFVLHIIMTVQICLPIKIFIGLPQCQQYCWIEDWFVLCELHVTPLDVSCIAPSIWNTCIGIVAVMISASSQNIYLEWSIQSLDAVWHSHRGLWCCHASYGPWWFVRGMPTSVYSKLCRELWIIV